MSRPGGGKAAVYQTAVYIRLSREDGDKAESDSVGNQRKLLMAEYCTQVVANTPYFKDGLSYQTGVGGLTKPMDNLF